MKAPRWQCFIILTAFLFNTFGPMPLAYPQRSSYRTLAIARNSDVGIRLPAPGVIVHLSPEFNPPILKGLKVHPDNPFRFDFILDTGDSSLPLVGRVREGDLKQQSLKLIRYFLASLTIPEKDLWVNLSPYEKDRIIPQSFGLTEMGRDLLAEDYMLKQITASLIYPESAIGKKFWKRIYEQAAKQYGTTNVAVNTFNKVWIVPEKAVVYENAKVGTAYVVEAKLKVMLEEDYLALEKNRSQPGDMFKQEQQRTCPQAGCQANQALNVKAHQGNHLTPNKDTSTLGSQILRTIVIPELTKEVNEGKNFAQLRQVYNSLILATWYKKKIKDSILAQVYADKNKIAGVEYKTSVIASEAKQSFKRSPRPFGARDDTELIYHRYLQAFKKGAYNYIKEETDPLTQASITRHYFSGGVDLAMSLSHRTRLRLSDHAMIVTRDPTQIPRGALVSTRTVLIKEDTQPSSQPVSLTAAFLSKKGVGHDENEDSGLADAQTGILLVADGIGGSVAGAISSRIARRVVQKLWTNDIRNSFVTKEEVRTYLREIVIPKVREVILKYIKGHPGSEGMGTTLSLLVIWQDPFTGKNDGIGVNIGDSRIYVRKANGVVKQLSKDDSFVQMLVDSPIGASIMIGTRLTWYPHITAQEAEIHPLRNVILDSLPSHDKLKPHQLITEALEEGDIVFIVSDGVSDNVGSRFMDVVKSINDPTILVFRSMNESTRIATSPLDEYEREHQKSPDDDKTVAALGLDAAMSSQDIHTRLIHKAPVLAQLTQEKLQEVLETAQMLLVGMKGAWQKILSYGLTLESVHLESLNEHQAHAITQGEASRQWGIYLNKEHPITTVLPSFVFEFTVPLAEISDLNHPKAGEVYSASDSQIVIAWRYIDLRNFKPSRVFIKYGGSSEIERIKHLLAMHGMNIPVESQEQAIFNAKAIYHTLPFEALEEILETHALNSVGERVFNDHLAKNVKKIISDIKRTDLIEAIYALKEEGALDAAMFSISGKKYRNQEAVDLNDAVNHALGYLGYTDKVRLKITGLEKGHKVFINGKVTTLEEICTMLEEIMNNALNAQRGGEINVEFFEDRNKVGIKFFNKGNIRYDLLRERAHSLRDRLIIFPDGDIMVKTDYVRARPLSEDEFSKLKDEDLLFIRGLSSQGKAHEDAAGGQGMNLIKDEILTLGGELRIETGNGNTAVSVLFDAADQAMVTQRGHKPQINIQSRVDKKGNYGGIDLTPANMNLQTKTGSPTGAFGDDNGIKLHLGPAQLARLQNAPGFVPVIINIQPMKDISRFLGVEK